MVELKSVLVPKLNDHVRKWRRLLDGTFMYVNCGSIEYVLSILNSFHNDIKFTYEQENNNRLLFRDVLFIRDDKKINSTLFREDTHNNLYLHWD